MSINVGIYVFPEVEVLDFAGPYEVFTTASRVAARLKRQTAPAFSAFTVTRQMDVFKARAGLAVVPDFDFASAPAIDVLIVPGGVVTAELAKPEVIAWLRQTADWSRLTASVCTGAFLLAQAGLLDGQRATTHWEDIADLRRDFPAVQVVENCRWVDAGKIVTSGGISAGIDMSLHLVERLLGRELAEKTTRQMEFRWDETAG
jgi:transcriptional regulator GlxA family with amidase domain